MIPQSPKQVWTIGHSTRTLEEFLALLAAHRIEAVADVRRFPGSRRWPHFARDALAARLEREGLVYEWFPELGGRRRPVPDSSNTGWRSSAFRGYADYMATDAFAEGLDRLVNLALGMQTAILCAESLWWRCHRRLIADVLCWMHFEVRHIMGPGTAVEHRYTSPARIVNGQLSYAGDDGTEPADG